MKSPRVLFYDIEVSPNTSLTFGGKHEVDVLVFTKPWYMLSFAYSWGGSNKIGAYSLPNFPAYKKDRSDDKDLCRRLWELMSEADILCGHNADAFDQKMSFSRFVKHGFAPPAPSQSIDTLKIARRYFKFSSNRLTDLGQYLGVGKKLPHHGIDTWVGCMDGDKNSWREMVEYNKRDVELLIDVYEKLKPYAESHPNTNVYTDTTGNCPVCGSNKVIRNGWRFTATGKTQRYQCTSCGRWSRSPKSEMAVVR